MASAAVFINQLHFQSSLLLVTKPSSFIPPRRRSTVSFAVRSPSSFPIHRRSTGRSVAAVAGQEAAPPPLTADLSSPAADSGWEVEIGGGEGGGEGLWGGGGGGGDGDGNGNGGKGGDKEEGGSDDENNSKKKKMSGGGMSMSQKLTLGYAALVGAGGVMGYMKSGSQKSLAAGGISALGLYFVYTQLPTRPAFASSLGLGLSAALLVVMGSRFKRSGKVFPAGIVSLVSFVMAGGYFHGILRGLHA